MCIVHFTVSLPFKKILIRLKDLSRSSYVIFFLHMLVGNVRISLIMSIFFFSQFIFSFKFYVVNFNKCQLTFCNAVYSAVADPILLPPTMVLPAGRS